MLSDEAKGNLMAAGRLVLATSSFAIGFIYAPEVFSIDSMHGGLMIKKFSSGVLFFLCSVVLIIIMETVFCKEQGV